MSTKAWIFIGIAVALIIIIIVVVKKKKSTPPAPAQTIVYQQPQQGPNKGQGFMTFLGMALPVVLDNINSHNNKPAETNMAGAPTTNVAAIA